MLEIGSDTKLLFTFLSLRFFDMWRERERETISSTKRTAHLVMFKISIHLCRLKSEKLKRRPQLLKIQLLKILKFSGLSLLGMTSSILPPHFLSGGLL